MLCGDAAALIDPFSGEGIEHAMRSGKFAAEMAVNCFKENDFSAGRLKAYDDIVYKKVWKTFKEHHILQKILGKREWLVNALISFGNISLVKKFITKIFY
jgi:flavin-dependent dehydrogenase